MYSPTSPSQVNGSERSWKTEELCFSQGKDGPLYPKRPQRGCEALPKHFPSLPITRLFAYMAHPQQTKPNPDVEGTTSMEFFSRTHNPQ